MGVTLTRPAAGAARWWCLLLGLWLIAANGALAEAIDEGRAAGVKAAWLRHIAALTTWPPNGDPRGAPISIGVMGPDPNGVVELIRARIETEQGLQAQGRRLQLVDMQNFGADLDGLAAALRQCDLLFLSEDGEADWALVRPLLDALPIVTVSEIESFARQGGMIEYVIDFREGRVRMIVNMGAVKRAGVQLSARLLALNSVIVMEREEEEEAE